MEMRNIKIKFYGIFFFIFFSESAASNHHHHHQQQQHHKPARPHESDEAEPSSVSLKIAQAIRSTVYEQFN